MAKARFLAWSDLHQELAPFSPPGRDVLAPLGPLDAVLVAGDISSHDDFVPALVRIAEATALPVVAIYGNHDFWGSSLEQVRRAHAGQLASLRLQRPDVDIRLIDRDVTEIAGVRIIGATLWTDYRFGNAPQDLNFFYATRGMKEFDRIKGNPTRPTLEEFSRTDRLTPQDLLREHEMDLAHIVATTELPHDGPTLVMTHHVPHPQAMNSRYAMHSLNASFVSDLSEVIAELPISAWLYGHVHDGRNIEVAGRDADVRLITNPRGYEHETTAFDPLFLIEL